MFLHDAIMEGITSGATEIRVEKLVQKYAELEQADAEGETGFQKEYGVRNFIQQIVSIGIRRQLVLNG